MYQKKVMYQKKDIVTRHPRLKISLKIIQPILCCTDTQKSTFRERKQKIRIVLFAKVYSRKMFPHFSPRWISQYGWFAKVYFQNFTILWTHKNLICEGSFKVVIYGGVIYEVCNIVQTIGTNLYRKMYKPFYQSSSIYFSTILQGQTALRYTRLESVLYK